jgi:plasmid stabilization system protein ParE
MTFRVEITRTAAREIEERYKRIDEQGRNSAEKWRAGLLEAVDALSTNPEMYPEAPEAEWFGEGLRELYYGKRRNTHRILFEVRGNVVYILRVRHGRQDLLGPEEL